MALESSCGSGGTNSGRSCSNQCPVPGCDTVSVFDGADASAPLVGQFSGLDIPDAIQSTGNSLYVLFETDTGNYGLNTAGVRADPGFYADWHFIQQIVELAGSGICPVAAMLTEAHGTLHDDERAGVDCSAACNTEQGVGAGYSDALDCFTTIHASTGSQVKLTFTQMNLELTGCHPDSGPGMGCPDGGCDYVALYDGADESAPLIGKYSGQPAPEDLPVIVSSGQDLHLRFVTDTSNCGIAFARQQGDPGWFADWDFLENGNIVILSRSVALSISLTLKASLLQESISAIPMRRYWRSTMECCTTIQSMASWTAPRAGSSDVVGSTPPAP